MNGSHSITEQIGACPQWHLGERPNSQYWKEQVFIYNILTLGALGALQLRAHLSHENQHFPCSPKGYKPETPKVPHVLIFFQRFYLFIFRERGKEGEREGKKHQCVVTSYTPPTGDLAYNPGLCPDWESNRRPFGPQASTKSTESHQPGPPVFLF